LSRLTRHDLTLVVAVMTLMRLLAIVALRPGGYVAETGPDSAYHFQLGRLAASGAYPYVDYWVEYPPLFPWLSVLAYKIATLMPAWIDQRFWFNLVLHGLIVPFDAANTVLVYALSKRASGAPFALKSAWLYATLFVPMFVVLGWFESIALFAVLLSLWAILADRPVLAGVAIGLGVLVKPYVALIGAVGLVHLSTWRKVGLLIGAGAIALLAGVSPFLIGNPQMLKAHVDTLLTLPGWSSPYALIDGVINHTDPRVADRFDPALASNPIAPSHVPWGLVTLGFVIVYAVVLIRSYRHPHQRAAAGLAGVTFVMYLLWSKGYSPQWSLHLMAFLCILMPNLRGALLLLVLEALYVIEWPVTFILLRADAGYLAALVVVRTLVMVGLGALFGALIFVRQERGWQRLRSASLAGSLAAVAAVIGLALGGLPVYAAQRYQADPMRDAVERIRSASTPDHAGVLFDRVDTYERLAPYLPGWPALAVLQLGGAADAWGDARVRSFIGERREVWYVVDWGAEKHRAAGDELDQQLSERLCIVAREFVGAARMSRYVNAQPSIDLNVSVDFEGGIRLSRAQISGAVIDAGDSICVELTWTAARPPTTDYTAFVHLLDAGGKIVAQSDVAPGSGYAPTTTWQPAQAIVDRHGLVTPNGLAPGAYRIAVGLYDLEGKRLPARPAADAVVLGTLEIRR
jgi:hypothetical protein